jgi:hypothetical protein
MDWLFGANECRCRSGMGLVSNTRERWVYLVAPGDGIKIALASGKAVVGQWPCIVIMENGMFPGLDRQNDGEIAKCPTLHPPPGLSAGALRFTGMRLMAPDQIDAALKQFGLTPQEAAASCATTSAPCAAGSPASAACPKA